MIVKPKLSAELIAGLREKALSNLGYQKRVTPDQVTQKILSKAIDAVHQSANPRGIYLEAPIIGINRQAIITETGAIRSPRFARLAGLCKGKRSLVFMIATIGDEWKRGLGKEVSVLRQLLFDAVASAAVELVAGLVEKQWREAAESKGLKAGSRFSPGYCDWDLKGQRVIFKALDASKIGVELTRHYVMVPEKTVSAVALIAEDLPAAAPCAFCPKDCPWRKIPCQSST